MKVLGQTALVFGICMVSEVIGACLPFAFPSGALAMVLLFLCFMLHILRVEQLQTVSHFLSDHMALFFIPAGMGILECLDALRAAWFPILLICVVSTWVTFGVTAYTVRLVVCLQNRSQKGGRRRV